MTNVKHAAEEIRLIIVALLITSLEITGESVISCGDLLPGQYLCSPPIIDFDTQQPCSCSPQNIALVNCTPAPDVICDSLGSNGTFTKEIDCQYTSGKSWKVALSLAVFFGWLGIDRLYLGYYALGLVFFASLKHIVFSGIYIFVMAMMTPNEMMADLEIEMMSDMYRRMSDTCKDKCVSSRYREGDLTKGEAVCIDRCVAKYLHVHEDLGKKLAQMTQQDEQTLQKIQHEQQRPN